MPKLQIPYHLSNLFASLPLQKELSAVNRISKEKKEAGILIKIKAFTEESKQKNLTVWLVAWTFCGLAIGSQVFYDDNPELRKMILIFLAFWAYFEFKVVKAFRWRKSGEEQFYITDDLFSYGRTYNNRGILKQYRKDLVNAVRPIEVGGNSLIKAFSESYWVIGGEQLAFTANGKVIPFGLRLNEKESKKLMKELNELLSKLN